MKDNIFNETQHSSKLQRAKNALAAVLQYEQDWLEHGVDSVDLYFDDVEGNWLEEFELNVDESKKTLQFTIDDVFSALENISLPRKFVKKIAIPKWLDISSLSSHDIQVKLLPSIEKRLNVVSSFSEAGNLLFSSDLNFLPKCQFKTQKKQTDYHIFVGLALSASSVILDTVKKPLKVLPKDAFELREAILEKSHNVDFLSILDICFDYGIPVFHFDSKPSAVCKVDGLISILENRPIIIISSQRKNSSWLSFILAHELGHLVNGHLKDGVIADVSFQKRETDLEEQEADDFARNLLLGKAPLNWSQQLSWSELKHQINILSKEYKISKGSLILNYAWWTGDWGKSMKLLNQVEKTIEPSTIINQHLLKYLDKSALNEDNIDYLSRIKVLAENFK